MEIRAAEPLVSVLIPFRNAESNLAVAIRSILNQSYRNFELILCDDGSRDDSPSIAKSFSDARIILISNAGEHGPAPARNALLRQARGKYIAWLDADDIALPNRLEKQVQWMEEHPETDIAGTFALLRRYHRKSRKLPANGSFLTKVMLFKNFILQPTVISKNFYTEENIFYNESCNYLEDYELWSRLNGVKTFANIPEFLTSYLVPLPEEEKQKREQWNFHANLHQILLLNARAAHIEPAAETMDAWNTFAGGLPMARTDIRAMCKLWVNLVRKDKGWYVPTVWLSFQQLKGNRNAAAVFCLLRVIAAIAV